jgi:hypothetical protein
MALLKCPDCGRDVSDAAPACPGCGRPVQAVPIVATRATSDERVIFQDDTITVTNVRAVVRQKTTYAMSNITSVREFVEPRPTVLLLLGICFLLLGFACISGPEIVSTLAILGLVAGAVLGLLYFLLKPKLCVRIGTAGAETNAIWSHDAAWTRKVVEAINNAIVSRG